MKDVVQYLKRSVAQLEEELAGGAVQRESEQHAWEERNRSLEVRLSQLQQEHQEQREELCSENMMLGGFVDHLQLSINCHISLITSDILLIIGHISRFY